MEVGRESIVDIATRHGMEGPGMESRWGARFSVPVQTSCTMGTGYLSWGVKWPEHGVDHPPSSSAEVKERVELYLYSSSGPLWPVIG
jgi:hypothetical protein